MVNKFERLYETFDKEEKETLREPWMLEEIDDLFLGFLSYSSEEQICTENHETLPCPKDFCEMSYESSFLEARCFDEMALKLKIVQRHLKKIWDTKYFPHCGWHPVAKAKNLILFKSPACQMFSSVKDEIEDSDWLKGVAEEEGTISKIKTLTKHFKEQNTWIFKKQSSRAVLESHHDSADLSSHRRLYSAVLQGSSPPPNHQLPADRNRISSFQFPTSKSREFDQKSEETKVNESSQSSYALSYNMSTTALASTSSSLPAVAEHSIQVNNSRRLIDVNALGLHCSVNHQQQQYPYYTTRTVESTPSNTSVYPTPTNYSNYHQYFPHQQANTALLGPRFYSSSFIPNTSVLNFRQTNYFPLMLQNATAPYAPYQPSFFNYQRGTFPSYRTMPFPPRPQVVLPSPGWYIQPPVKIGQPTVNMLATRPHMNVPTGQHNRTPNTSRPIRLAKPGSCSPISSAAPAGAGTTIPKDDILVNQDLENIVAKTVSAVLDDPDPFVPVTGVSSDELELQALEQYSPSNTNVFQDLERQAAEQYDETSENWNSPPKSLDEVIIVTFGGCLFNIKLVRFRCAEEILGLGCSDTIKAEFPNLLLVLGIDRN